MNNILVYYDAFVLVLIAGSFGMDIWIHNGRVDTSFHTPYLLLDLTPKIDLKQCIEKKIH